MMITDGACGAEFVLNRLNGSRSVLYMKSGHCGSSIFFCLCVRVGGGGASIWVGVYCGASVSFSVTLEYTRVLSVSVIAHRDCKLVTMI
jgi:hypothetical protein